MDRFWTPFIEQQQHSRLGMWVGLVDGAPVGWWSLWPLRETPGEAEAGWRLVRSAWGRGLGREGARALFDWGFSSPDLRLVVADAMAINRASRRVMEALGMRHVRTEVREWDDPLPGSEDGEVHYAVTADEWRAARRTASSTPPDGDGSNR